MAKRCRELCRVPGCGNLAVDRRGYCAEHLGDALAAEARRAAASEARRGSAAARGYNWRWAKYSRWYLQQPGHQLCALRLSPTCAVVAQCVDHIDPPDGPSDARFWDPANHQPACISCNSVKGHRCMIGRHRQEPEE